MRAAVSEGVAPRVTRAVHIVAFQPGIVVAVIPSADIGTHCGVVATTSGTGCCCCCCCCCCCNSSRRVSSACLAPAVVAVALPSKRRSRSRPDGNAPTAPSWLSSHSTHDTPSGICNCVGCSLSRRVLSSSADGMPAPRRTASASASVSAICDVGHRFCCCCCCCRCRSRCSC